MNDNKAVVATTPVQPAKAVRIALTQESKSGKQNASFLFHAKGENLNDFLTDTCKKIVGVMSIQAKIKEKGGKNNAFGLTKGGNFELSVTVSDETETTRLLNNFVFSLKSLGESNPDKVLVAMVEGYKLLTE